MAECGHSAGFVFPIFFERDSDDFKNLKFIHPT